LKINKKLKIAILTYNKAHKKSRDIFFGFKKLGYKNINIIEKKFKTYKKRNSENFLKHRPEMMNGKSFSKIIDNKKIYKFTKSNIKLFDYIIIGGSGIIEKKFIKKNLYINCHSGIIPSSRGLDSVKWDILKNRISGCTLHFIDHRTDLGKIISHRMTKTSKSESMYNFFQKHYKNEIDMLINFEKFINSPKLIKTKLNKPKMRMGLKKEKLMIKNFKKWKLHQIKNLKKIN
jgi:phosphoribosylglycinamide formyltransferase-1